MERATDKKKFTNGERCRKDRSIGGSGSRTHTSLGKTPERDWKEGDSRRD